MIFDFENISIGVDIESIERFEKYNNPDNAFVKRLFSQKEVDYCYKTKNFAPHLAARYCAKEALYKAFASLGLCGFHYSDFEILNDEKGVPIVVLPDDLTIYSAKISLSHSKNTAIANVIVIKK